MVRESSQVFQPIYAYACALFQVSTCDLVGSDHKLIWELGALRCLRHAGGGAEVKHGRLTVLAQILPSSFRLVRQLKSLIRSCSTPVPPARVCPRVVSIVRLERVRVWDDEGQAVFGR